MSLLNGTFSNTIKNIRPFFYFIEGKTLSRQKEVPHSGFGKLTKKRFLFVTLSLLVQIPSRKCSINAPSKLKKLAFMS